MGGFTATGHDVDMGRVVLTTATAATGHRQIAGLRAVTQFTAVEDAAHIPAVSTFVGDAQIIRGENGH